jgi:glycosyltransferase involved in cell wall biosynthesis
MQFVYFGNDWFADNRTSSHHIARRLGAKFPLLYIETPGLRTPKASGRDIRKLLRKLVRTFRPPELVAPHLWVMTLPQIPFHQFAIIRTANRVLSRMRVRQATRKLGFQDIVNWFHVPHPGFLAHRLGERLTVFYCIDEYAKLPDVDSRSILAMDNRLSSEADIVFVCSKGLLDSHLPLNRNTHLSPHGVDTDLFAGAAGEDTQTPSETQKWTRPIIGFWGLVDRWVDLSIVEHIARSRPDWTLVFIGRTAVDVSALAALENVHFVGIKPYSALPGWAKAIDVCILPFAQNSLMLNSSPLKLREYLATGKPIVSVPLPDVQQFGALVETASDGPGFVQAISRCLSQDSREQSILRQKAVTGCTWDATVSNVMAKLESELAARGLDLARR